MSERNLGPYIQAALNGDRRLASEALEGSKQASEVAAAKLQKCLGFAATMHYHSVPYIPAWALHRDPARGTRGEYELINGWPTKETRTDSKGDGEWDGSIKRGLYVATNGSPFSWRILSSSHELSGLADVRHFTGRLYPVELDSAFLNPETQFGTAIFSDGSIGSVGSSERLDTEADRFGMSLGRQVRDYLDIYDIEYRGPVPGQS